MPTHHEQELAALKEKLLLMGGHAETGVRNSMKALVERDDALANSIKESDDVLDRLEMEVDEMSVGLLAKAPLAIDLRFITIAMKISRDLERVGDETTAVAKRVMELNAEPQLKPYIDIPRMASIALEMLGGALDAFVNRRPDQARAIVPRDQEVNAIHRQLQRELSSYMVENPANITRCLAL
ncbi:MAG: phosphate signaling complex protein PhoU, partial [Verrucomicrobia bacterium]|nr:phosphate signaling complex protein PhoU [Verrucomicrobiota bacterium]